MEKSWFERARPALTGAWHFVAALLIGYLFIVILMVATTQSRISDDLAKLNTPLDYGAGYGEWQDSLHIDFAIRAIVSQRNTNTQKRNSVVAQIDEKTAAYQLSAAEFASLQQRLDGFPGCKMADSSDPASAAQAVGLLRMCVGTGDALPAPLMTQIKAVLTNSQGIITSAKDLVKAQHDLDNIDRLDASYDETQKSLDLDKAPLKDAIGAFSEMKVLEEHGWLGGTFLVSFPPAMIQILMAFVSGLFGALLVTLVLIVYPNNGLTFTSTNASYEARVFLGGLISVCVFVVMGGGTAVLGAGSSFADGKANFLAFCALGLLAGMFSDRVAYWLSQRANSLFETDDAAKKAAEAAHASDAAKHAADTAAAANAEAAQAAAARAASTPDDAGDPAS